MGNQKNKKAGLLSYIASPLMTILLMSIASLVFFLLFKDISTVVFFMIIMTVDVSCKIIFALLPLKSKAIARYVSLILFGLLLFVLAGLMGQQNFQIEGFFFFIFAGVFGGVIIHYINGKIIGPLIYGRNWCGWSCWTPMVLDLLPFKKSPGRKKGLINSIKYIYFFISIIVVALLVYLLKYTIHNPAPTPEYQSNIRALYWFAIGNVLYYLAGIILAIILKDNRAFCKYICPVSVIMKISGSLALLKIKGNKEKCTGCGKCVKVCKMDINIPGYVQAGERIKANECILCLHCIAECPQGVLSASVGFDISGKNKLR